ncbi:unnamed protein product [Closterium sp. NIES-53]
MTTSALAGIFAEATLTIDVAKKHVREAADVAVADAERAPHVLRRAADVDVDDPATWRELTLPSRGISRVDSLAACSQLTRLDLSGNNLTSLEGLSSCVSLRWLDIASNSISSLQPLTSLTALLVLKASHNMVGDVSPVTHLAKLQALILNNNLLDSLCNLAPLTALNTLVLSHNELPALGNSLCCLSALKKLSLSSNGLTSLTNDLSGCMSLEELRLAHNHISALSPALSSLTRLRILDLSSNRISSLKLLSLATLAAFPHLNSLSLRGNPLLGDNPSTVEAQNLPSLQLLHPALFPPTPDSQAPASLKAVGFAQGGEELSGRFILSFPLSPLLFPPPHPARPHQIVKHLPRLRLLDSRKVGKGGGRGQEAEGAGQEEDEVLGDSSGDATMGDEEAKETKGEVGKGKKKGQKKKQGSEQGEEEGQKQEEGGKEGKQEREKTAEVVKEKGEETHSAAAGACAVAGAAGDAAAGAEGKRARRDKTRAEEEAKVMHGSELLLPVMVDRKGGKREVKGGNEGQEGEAKKEGKKGGEGKGEGAKGVKRKSEVVGSGVGKVEEDGVWMAEGRAELPEMKAGNVRVIEKVKGMEKVGKKGGIAKVLKSEWADAIGEGGESAWD